MAKDSVKVSGVCRICDTKGGKLLVEAKNLVVSSGLNHIRDRISGLALVPDVMAYVAVGSGATSPASGDTALESQLSTRMAAVITEPEDYQVQYTVTSAAGSHTGNWYECGIFNAATSGTMLCRVTFGLLTKGAADSFTIEYIISFADDAV